MSQLMCEREHLGGLGVRAVDEHKRREIVCKGEAPELLRIELAAIV